MGDERCLINPYPFKAWSLGESMFGDLFCLDWVWSEAFIRGLGR